jgi:hypothetical protein
MELVAERGKFGALLPILCGEGVQCSVLRPVCSGPSSHLAAPHPQLVPDNWLGATYPLSSSAAGCPSAIGGEPGSPWLADRYLGICIQPWSLAGVLQGHFGGPPFSAIEQEESTAVILHLKQSD